MKVYSIFDSIDGEVNHFGQGHPTTFIRLAGCHLNCVYCDTLYARDPKGGKEMAVHEILIDVIPRRPYKVTITGGEPLEQEEELGNLVTALAGAGVFVTIETNGAWPIPSWPCYWIADYKLPGSGMESKMGFGHYYFLTPDDFIKFVIRDRTDYLKALKVMTGLYWSSKPKFAMSPITPGLPAATLIKWMRDDFLNDVILNVQLHKLLNLTEDK